MARWRLTRGLVLLSLVNLLGCMGTSGGTEPAGQVLTPQSQVQLPDVSAAGVNCQSATFSDLRAVRDIYDAHFAHGLPAGPEDFGWHSDPDLVTPELVQRVVFPPIDTPEANGYISFNNCSYSRSSAKNADIFQQFDPWSQVHEPFRRYNPRDFTPAAATYYARSEQRDRIAEQFVYRVACAPDAMRTALSLCPDCDDVFVPLSGEDVYRIFEVHFVRQQGDQLQVSRKFKFIGIDASGSVQTHVASKSMIFSRVGGQIQWAKWRGEIAGRLYAMLAQGGPVPLMIRSSAVNDYGCGAGAPPPSQPPPSEPPPSQPPPSQPPAPAQATEGQGCFQRSCAQGLSCTPVLMAWQGGDSQPNLLTGNVYDRRCLQPCPTAGTRDGCQAGEICSATADGVTVCFNDNKTQEQDGVRFADLYDTPAVAFEGQGCWQRPCGAGLSCTAVQLDPQAGTFNLGAAAPQHKVCMEQCASDLSCETGETCTADGAGGKVCFAAGKQNAGFVTL